MYKIVYIATLFFSLVGFVSAEELQDANRALFNNQIKAISEEDYNSFIENGTFMFRNSLSKSQFSSVSKTVGKRLLAGYEKEYLGVLKQQGQKVHLWKLSYSDQGDDNLVKLVIDGQKISGFWIQ